MRTLTEREVAAWVEDELLSPTRDRPIVVVTTQRDTDRCWIEPEALARDLGDLAAVVVIPTGEPTWALSDALPPRLEVYGGALRIYWPGFARDSEPQDHRLFLIFDASEAGRVREAVVAAVQKRQQNRAPSPPAKALPPERVGVVAKNGDEIIVAAPGRRGPIVASDLSLHVLALLLEIGCQLDARPRQREDGRWTYSIRDLLPDPWPRFAATAKPGHTYTCRVQNLDEKRDLVFVDVLPGVVGVCQRSELDHTRVDRLGDFVQPGELLDFTVLDVDAAKRKLALSRKQAFTSEPRALPPLFDGGRPFVWLPGMPWFKQPRAGQRVRTTTGPTSTAPRAAETEIEELAEKVDALEQELRACRDERQALVAQIRALREQVQDGKRQRRSLEDQLAAATSAGGDPLASEPAFLQAVRVAYARMFDEGSRHEQPLQRLRTGPRFLASVRDTPGIDVDKLLAVCAEVGAGIAHQKAGREVHPLRAGERGAGDRVRERDGARAFRCALQVHTPSARRLHWWNVPGPGGATIEFASVGLHDEFDIPE